MVEPSTKFSFTKDTSDILSNKYGVLDLIASQCPPEERYKNTALRVQDLNDAHVDQEVYIRARLNNKRMKKTGFLILRSEVHTVQCVIAVSEFVSEQMFKFADSIPNESIIDVRGIARKSEMEIKTCSVKFIEVDVRELFVVSAAPQVLPFQLADANRPVNQEDEEEKQKVVIPDDLSADPNLSEADKKKLRKEREKLLKQQEKDEKKAKQTAAVGLNTRFNNRVLDFRVAASHSLIKVSSAVSRAFREFFDNKEFVEIHSPKLIGGASEGGANVFKLTYFNQPACLAQSPQLYKQMCIAGDFPGVYEIGTVFRAEDSNTPRHLCEFIGLDFEMPIQKHYFEIIDIIGELFYYLIPTVQERCANDFSVINEQYKFEPIQLSKEFLKLEWDEGMAILEAGGVKHDPTKDLSTEVEKKLGDLVKEKYGTDFFLLYGYPVGARPFYTMVDPQNPQKTLSYDAFIRGEEILSGAQRVHDYDMLVGRINDFKIPIETLKDYCEAFKLGCLPHGGAGLGLERIVKLMCGIKNVKKCSLFPRDPSRLTP